MSGATTPVIPPRSALRSVPAPKRLDLGDSLEFHTTPLGPVLFKTPSLSSGSDGDIFDDATTHLPAGTAYRSPIATSPSVEERERGFFGRKKLALERDPARVRDGRESKESHTGVYTRKYHLTDNNYHKKPSLTSSVSSYIPRSMWSSTISFPFARLHTPELPPLPHPHSDRKCRPIPLLLYELHRNHRIRHAPNTH